MTEELTAGEMGELSGILARRRDAPPKGSDVKQYIGIILREAKYGGSEWVKSASDGDMREFFEDLRQKKKGKDP